MVETDLALVLAKVKGYMDEQEYPEAIALCKESLKDLEEGANNPENERRKMQLLFTLSDICHVSGNWVDGLMYLSTVINRSSQLSDPNIRSEAVIRSGDILSKMGKWDKALDKYSEAEKLVNRFKNPYLLARTYIGRGVIFWRQGKYGKAMENAIEGRRIGIEIGNKHLTGSASSLMASVYYDTREYQKAITENDDALESFRALGDNIEIARILNNKGEVFKAMGEHERAIGIFKDGLEVLLNTMNNRSLGYLYTNLAECQIRTGNKLEAEMTRSLADNVVRLSEDKYIKAQLSMVTALIEQDAGNFRESIKHISQAESIMSKLDIPYDLGIIQLEHARMLKEADVKGAFDKYRNAILSFKKADTPRMISIAEAELGSLGA